jgi:hypothetical protein
VAKLTKDLKFVIDDIRIWQVFPLRNICVPHVTTYGRNGFRKLGMVMGERYQRFLRLPFAAQQPVFGVQVADLRHVRVPLLA